MNRAGILHVYMKYTEYEIETFGNLDSFVYCDINFMSQREKLPGLAPLYNILFLLLLQLCVNEESYSFANNIKHFKSKKYF